jgi:hypothetical protein
LKFNFPYWKDIKPDQTDIHQWFFFFHFPYRYEFLFNKDFNNKTNLFSYLFSSKQKIINKINWWGKQYM